jgi:predicted amino acid dehydrogenase
MGLPFALLGHPAHPDHIAAVVGRPLPPAALLAKMLEWAPPFVMAEFELRSTSGAASGLYITCPFLPRTLREQPFGCLAKVHQACRLAGDRGAALVCLGGFTSIAARRGSRHLCLPYTTGGRLTAALAVAASLKAAGLLGLEPSEATVAIIGGLGEIGLACARSLSPRVARLILTSRRPRRQRLPSGMGALLVGDNELACAQADIVIAAAAAPEPLLSTEHLRPGAVCCDVGYPANVADSGREDVILFRGGLVRTPHPQEFGFDLGLPASGLTYGCFAEAMVMALEGEADLPAARLEAAFDHHGFEAAGFWRGSRQLGPADFERAGLARSAARTEGWL